ncbi:MAG: hypothetical protein J2P28_25990, partial [Actinobacteria bacterium]|nr:hypothetical protein [Actinomycetota bacterium]
MLEVGAGTGYSALPLGDLCNTGVDVLGPGPLPELGAVTLRGFPFAIGVDPVRCFVGLGRGLAEHLALPLEATAHNVLFAWRLLESPILEGGPAGIAVAELRFRFEDGTDERVTIRDRFEIAVVPPGWGQNPFRAQPDVYDSLPRRYEGAFDSTGSRQTEARQGEPRSWWIWAWRNPRPDVPLRSVEIGALGPRFVIAGITVGDIDEGPLQLPGASTLRIDVIDPEIAARTPLDLEVAVDRGVSTFTYSLPTQSLEHALQDPLRGFGEPVNRGSSPAYVRVASLPSGTVIVRSGGGELGSATWPEIVAGEAQAGPARIRLIDPGRNWVRTEIVDAASGRPVPCRVHFRSPDGVPYAPHGHHSHVGGDMGTWHIDVGGDVRLGRLSYAYVDGICEGWLPRGEVIVDIARGFEYEPLRKLVTIEPGQQRLQLELT